MFVRKTILCIINELNEKEMYFKSKSDNGKIDIVPRNWSHKVINFIHKIKYNREKDA